MPLHVSIIGLGLIGGSVARDLRRTGFASRLTGVEANPAHAAQALERGLVDTVQPLEQAVASADLTVLAVPVDGLLDLLPRVLDALSPTGVALDLGSTKRDIVATANTHPRRSRFVATHPMAGTENSGPAAAVDGLFQGKVGILCNTRENDADAIARAEAFYSALDMRTVTMEASEHDVHVAWLSHTPHVVAFALALATLQKEKDGRVVFDLAGGGFSSIVRVAQSAPGMWVPILMQNRAAVGEAIAAMQRQLADLGEAIAAGDAERLRARILEANRIRQVLASLSTPRPPLKA